LKLENIGFGRRENAHFSKNRANGLNYHLLLVIRSNANFFKKEQKVTLNNGAVILFRKGSPQFFSATDDNYMNDWVGFTLSADEEIEFFNNPLIFDTPIQNESLIAFCSEIIKLMQKEVLSGNECDYESTKLLLKAAICKLHSATVGNTNFKPYYNKLTSLRAKIYNNPSAEYTVEHLADEVHLSKSYFLHLYKEYFNTSPIADTINSRMEFAKSLLLSTEYTINEISEILNYTNDTQFMRQFKSKTGMTPSKYRKDINQ